MAAAASGRRSAGRRAGTALLAVLVLVAAVAAGWWGARATLEPSVDAGAEAADVAVVWAQATQSSVGRTLPLSTTLRQPAQVVAVNGLSGVVTSLSPGEVDVGDTVYAVAGVPVRVVAGQVPFYRDLAREVSGDDVAQLQEALIELGHLEGEADGEFGAGTHAAVRAWQAELGMERTGVVGLGELVAVPSLPAVVQVGESIQVGRMVGGGEEAVLAPTGERHFVLVVTSEQAGLIPVEATVEITWQEHLWTAAIGSVTQDQFASTEFELVAAGGGEVCGDACDTLPGDAQVTLRSQVVIVPRITGTAVPGAAVRTRADGTAYVITRGGEQEVTVRGSGGGVAIVDGVEVGTEVQVLGGAPGAPAPGPPGGGDEQPPGDDGAEQTTGP